MNTLDPVKLRQLLNGESQISWICINPIGCENEDPCNNCLREERPASLQDVQMYLYDHAEEIADALEEWEHLRSQEELR